MHHELRHQLLISGCLKVRIVKEDGEIAQLGVDGELQFRSATMLTCYKEQTDLHDSAVTKD